MHAIGIDLGTTNSLVAYLDNGEPKLIPNALGEVLTPSVVGLGDDGALIVGQTAKHRLVSHPDQTVGLFKRKMGTDSVMKLGRKSFRAEELSAMILQNLKKDAEAHLDGPIGNVVVSVPAYFNEVQRRAVRNACQIAGLEVNRLINEPTAAALAYGLNDKDAESTFLVFDLGGGTFDVSILELFEGVMEVRATAGDAFTGGEDFTDAIAKHLREQKDPWGKGLPTHQEAVIRRAAEGAKLELSHDTETNVKLAIDGLELDHTISRDKFEEISAAPLKRLKKPVERALHDAGISLQELDRVVLVGGATRMPIIRSMIARQLQKFPEAILDPDHVVALGAAVQSGLAARDEALSDVVMTDVSAFTLGIETAQQMGERVQVGYFLPIIERNSTVPISREETVSTLHPGQTEIRVEVYQGEAPLVRDNIKLGEFSMPIPRNKKDHESISIRFTYDISGLLEVEATSLTSGKTEKIVIGTSGLEMSESDIAKRLKELNALKVHPRDQAQNERVLARLGEAYAMTLGADRQFMQARIAEFQALLEAQNIEDIEKARTEIDEMLNSFETNYVR